MRKRLRQIIRYRIDDDFFNIKRWTVLYWKYLGSDYIFTSLVPHMFLELTNKVVKIKFWSYDN